jgi:manganese/zinc/iron transport system permease protein
MTLVNFVIIVAFYKELKLATFDAGLAAALGFSPAVIHYALMGLVSMTTVGAFSAVGAILVVALMIVPAATAYLLTDRLSWMIGLSVLIGAGSAAAGYYAALELNVSISGMMVVALGVCFAVAVLFSPTQGIVVRFARRRRLRVRYDTDSLLLHLYHHRTGSESREHITSELRWTEQKLAAAFERGRDAGFLELSNDRIALTASGRQAAERILSTLGKAPVVPATA